MVTWLSIGTEMLYPVTPGMLAWANTVKEKSPPSERASWTGTFTVILISTGAPLGVMVLLGVRLQMAPAGLQVQGTIVVGRLYPLYGVKIRSNGADVLPTSTVCSFVWPNVNVNPSMVTFTVSCFAGGPLLSWIVIVSGKVPPGVPRGTKRLTSSFP